ncbi:Nucleoside transporter family protein [Trichomonas vaginalis G3]|uniref:Nucleoside transporter family protein n=1 Tax=Trichomonas vaginalis (strain ATCC PRA-98 / G3) TaxID=412133 RepID=A2FSP2_TRIV3|nr:nucleoside transmembrane transporter protein [Trichomonas vaginalis G3]EAX92073.1 Nucleoside transporter family protein [Trichomonas vaginalis G3]KAI5543709.1 nucleoside transmembrane transporter protein [Trichomonas vaginalis G3]|eukprot:XP_001305003.1 Nucleoside transporter family protein [Trichomonas vaginalis G3]
MTLLDNRQLLEEKDILISDYSEMTPDPQGALFFWLGNASLLVYNVVINAIDIYIHLSHRKSVGNDLARAYNFPCSLIALVLCFIKIPNQKILFIISLLVLFFDLLAFPLLIIIPMSESVVYWGTIAAITVSGVFSSIIMSGSFAVSTQFADETAGFISAGNGLCGILAAVARIITKGLFSSESQLKISSIVYFALAALTILGTLIFFILKLRNPDISNRFIFNSYQKENTAFISQIFTTLKSIWLLWIAEALTYFITLIIFPGYVCSGPEGPLKSWTPVLITTVFCIFDFIGRFVASKFIWPSLNMSPLASVFRIIFIPLEIISIQKIVNFREPWFTLALQIPFALTNGYVGTILMIYGSNHPDLDSEKKKLAGYLMTFAINVGIIIAMFLTFILPKPSI